MPDFLQKLRKMLEFEEGLKLYPYDDQTGKIVKAPVGNITIGIGHNLSANGVSTDVIDLMLKEDCEWALETCSKLFPVFPSLSVNRQLAIIDMAFNMGEEKLKKFSRFAAAVELERWEEAGAEIKDSDYYLQRIERAERKIAMITKNIFPY